MNGGMDGEMNGEHEAGVPQRLAEGLEVEPGSPESRAIELLGAARPYRAAVGRKQRVWSALAATPAHRPTYRLRAAVVAAVLIGGGAIGRAAVGHWPGWMIRAYEGLVGPPAAPARPLAERESRAPVHRSGRVALEDAAPASSAPTTSSTSALAAPPSRHVEAAVTSRPRRPAATPPSADIDSDETAPVLAAMRALRLDHNPVQARALLASYLVHHPGGALAEEALAISIEAAVTHHDADAALLARRYLRLYPAGPFGALARNALAAP